MLYYFKKGKNGTETHKKESFCAVYGEGSVTDRTYQKWFSEFLDTINILAK